MSGRRVTVTGIQPSDEIGRALQVGSGPLVIALNGYALFLGEVRIVEFVDGGIAFQVLPPKQKPDEGAKYVNADEDEP